MAYKKGESGNPGGRIKGKDKQIRELLLPQVNAAVKKLVEWMNSDNPKASVSACKEILDRVYGKPTQQVEAKGEVHVKVSFEGS